MAAVVLTAVLAAACGKSSPTAPSNGGPGIAGVSLASSSAAPGGTVQGTVTLSSAATSAVSVSLSSSNTTVASVQSPATIQAGASSGTFSVSAIAPGSATITASLNGTSQSSNITVTSGLVLSAISLNPSSVVGGKQVTATVTLSGAAPSGGAVVSLSGSDPAIVPANVTVPAGADNASFVITTRAVGGTVSTTITASYGGVSKSASLSVTPPTTATANFGVTGPTESDTCTLTNDGHTLSCTFDASTSTAPGTIVAYEWSYGSAAKFSQTTTGAVLTNPTVDCSIIPAPPFPAGTSWFPLTVTLRIRDSLGNTAEATNSGARVIPKGVCGF